MAGELAATPGASGGLLCGTNAGQCVGLVTSLSDEVTEGSTEVTQSPTVLYRSDESLRVASSVLDSQGGGRALRAKPFCGERGPVELRAVNAIDCP